MNQRNVAKLAGVSSATVSRVINNDPSVSVKTAKKVIEIIHKHMDIFKMLLPET